MPSLGQSSGSWKGNNSALRILHQGIKNTLGVLGADAFTQANPPAVSTNVSAKCDTTRIGTQSGSVAFIRPDLGQDYISGPGSAAAQLALQGNAVQAAGYCAVGVFLNAENGNAWENTPALASGRGTHSTASGSYGCQLYETVLIATTADGVNSPAGHTLTYFAGCSLVASRNGFLMPSQSVGADSALDAADLVAITAESYVKNSNGSATTIGVLRQAPDSVHSEIIFDQRI